jgi:hypothetical protein
MPVTERAVRRFERQKIDLTVQDEEHLLALSVQMRTHVVTGLDDHLEAGHAGLGSHRRLQRRTQAGDRLALAGRQHDSLSCHRPKHHPYPSRLA